jgi:hypothetical protein
MLKLMKSSLSILLDNEYVELMYFSDDILMVISIIFSMDLHHIRLLKSGCIDMLNIAVDDHWHDLLSW